MTSQRPNIQKYGFSQINEVNASDAMIDIVFVHGLQGHPENTFSTSSEAPQVRHGFLKLLRVSRKSSAPPMAELEHAKIFWPYDLLAQDTRFQRSRILTWGYESKVTEIWNAVSHESTSRLGHNLLVGLQQIRKNRPDRPLIFVAHSLGGILVKIALLRSRNLRNRPEFFSVYLSTVGIVFLGTPHKGSDAADWGQLASNISGFALRSRNTAVLKGLKPKSEMLENYAADFISLLSDDLPKIFFHSFYETKGMSGIIGLSAEIVPPSSAVIQHSQETAMGINGNHSEICKFRNSNDAGYQAIVSALEDYVGTAESRWQVRVEQKQEEFCHAVELGDETTVRNLLEWGVEPDREEKYYLPKHSEGTKRPLWIAAQEGHAGVLQLLLECNKGVDVDASSNNKGETALSQTAIYGREVAAGVLLDKGGANVNGVGREWPPLCYAAHYFGGAGLVRLFIEKGADINRRAEGGIGPTALHLAACPFNGEVNSAVIIILLEAGAEIDALDEVGQTPEDRALKGGCSEAIAILRKWRQNKHQQTHVKRRNDLFNPL